MSNNRRSFLYAGLTAALLALGMRAAPALPATVSLTRPNIILILADDLGYGDLGCFGSTKIRTPHLDELARQGTRFTPCYAGLPVCAPSRGVLLTGLHPGHGRIHDNSPMVGGEPETFADGQEGGIRLSLTSADHTFAEDLHAAGYVTGAAGKWGVGEPRSDGTPGKHGFDEWLVLWIEHDAGKTAPSGTTVVRGARHANQLYLDEIPVDKPVVAERVHVGDAVEACCSRGREPVRLDRGACVLTAGADAGDRVVFSAGIVDNDTQEKRRRRPGPQHDSIDAVARISRGMGIQDDS